MSEDLQVPAPSQERDNSTLNSEGTDEAYAEVSPGTNEASSPSKKILTAKDVSPTRRANLRRLMEERSKIPAEIMNATDLGDKEKRSLGQVMYAAKSDKVSANVSVASAELIAPVLGVDKMEILGELTTAEREKMYDTLSGGSTSDKKLTTMRGKALDTAMTKHQLTAQDVAQLIEEDEFKQAEIADEVASARLGEKLLSDELAYTLAKELQISEEDLGIGKKQGAVSMKNTKSSKKTTRRSKARKKAITTKNAAAEKAAIEGDTVETTLELSVDELQHHFGDKLVQVIKKGSGRHALRLEAPITKDELLSLVLSKFGK